MSESCAGELDGIDGRGRDIAVTLGMAEGLCLAASPAFAVMAFVTGILDGGVPDALCTALGSPITSMALMYALMCAFHLPPWLKLLSNRNCVNGSRSISAPSSSHDRPCRR